MKGLYINVPRSAQYIEQHRAVLGNSARVIEIKVDEWNITTSYHQTEWPDGPVYSCPESGTIAIASGWMVFQGKYGNLLGFVNTVCDAVDTARWRQIENGLDAGAFVVLILRKSGPLLVTDPFGLHPHYALREGGNPFSQLAPSPGFIEEARLPDKSHKMFLQKMNHFVGNITAYVDITRLDPGSVLTRDHSYRYFDYECSIPSTGAEIVGEFERSLTLINARKRILPISGGLDSRLLLACGKYDYGYTFGPRETGDRPVARQFANRFTEYKEFSLLDFEYHETIRSAGLLMFDGICPKPFLELLVVYKWLYSKWGEGCSLYDGYLGDVLTRGTYLRFRGIHGAFLKILPWYSITCASALSLLRKRYKVLTDAEFDLVRHAYDSHIRQLVMSEPKKAMLFEILYGRGARYSLNGGTTMANQFFSVVQPFFIPKVFRRLMSISAYDAVSYRAMRDIWRGAPENLSRPLTYSGFSPLWNPHISRTTVLIVKGLNKVNILRRAGQFDRELSQIEWR